MAFYVYMLASRKNGTLYVSSTDALIVRVSQHKQGLTPGFTSEYGVKDLVWYEPHDTREGAFRRERRIKDWKRAWKVRLIEKRNLAWRDLYDELVRGPIGEPMFLPIYSAHPLPPAHPGESRDPGQVGAGISAIDPGGAAADPCCTLAVTCPGSRPPRPSPGCTDPG